MNDEIEKYEKLLIEIDDEIDDVVENFKHMLTFNDIKDINILNFYNEINNLLINRQYIENTLFNLKH